MRLSSRGAADLPADLGEVFAHLAAAYPQEGCGVILQNAAGAFRVRPLRNAAASRTHYRFAPEEWLAVLREAEGSGEQVSCVFHSHVDAGPHFSEEDREAAAPGDEPLLPGVAWLVVTISGGQVSQAAVYRWAEGGFAGAEVPTL